MDRKPRDPDERVSIPLDPDEALKRMLKADPAKAQEQCPKTWQGKPCRLEKGHLGPCQFNV